MTHKKMLATTMHDNLVMRGRGPGGLMVIGSWGCGGSWGLSWFIAIARMEIRNISHQAFFQRSRAAAVQGVRQVATHIGVAELPTHIGAVVRGQELRIGQQLIDFPIAIDPVSGHAHARGCGTFKRALMQRANSCDGISFAVSA